MVEWTVERELKRDVFGSVELLRGPSGRIVRRIASGSRWPGSRLLARLLLHRERRALQRLAGLPHVPQLLDDRAAAGAADSGGRAVDPRRVLLRTFLDGVPLHAATALPADFFALLSASVAELHARGVCHNDLHKENNVLVGPDGRPRLLDFQLASVHAWRGRHFLTRCGDDLRHVEKHRRRYEAAGDPGRMVPLDRSRAASWWRLLVKPLYNWLTRRVLRSRRGEPRRPREGPWPHWTAAVGPPADCAVPAPAPRSPATG